MRRVFAVVLVLALLPGCALFQSLFGKFREPSLGFRGVSLGEVSLSGLTLNLAYRVSNPNAVAVTVDHLEYAVFVEGRRLVTGQPSGGLSVPAAGHADLTLPARVEFADVAPVLQTFLTRDTATYRLEGTAGLATPVGRINVPLRREGTFEIPKVPRMAFGLPRVVSLSITGARIEIPMVLTNVSSFPLPINALTGVLSLSGAVVGSVGTGDLGALNPGQAREVTVPVTIHFLQAAAAAAALAQGGGELSLTGEVRSGTATVPLQWRQSVTIKK